MFGTLTLGPGRAIAAGGVGYQVQVLYHRRIERIFCAWEEDHV